MSLSWDTIDGVYADGAEALIAKHWAANGRLHAEVPLDLDLAAYRRIEAAGGLRTLAVRDGGVLKGGATYLFGPHPMHNATIHALCQVFYVEPGRALRFVPSMVRAAETLTAERAAPGLSRVVYYVPVGSPFVRVLKRMGYRVAELMMEKIVGERDGD